MRGPRLELGSSAPGERRENGEKTSNGSTGSATLCSRGPSAAAMNGITKGRFEVCRRERTPGGSRAPFSDGGVVGLCSRTAFFFLVYARACVGVWSAARVIRSRVVLSVKGNPKSGNVSCDPAVRDNMVLRTAGQEGCGRGS